jgi:hypothetical protein
MHPQPAADGSAINRSRPYMTTIQKSSTGIMAPESSAGQTGSHLHRYIRLDVAQEVREFLLARRGVSGCRDVAGTTGSLRTAPADRR